MTVEVTRLPNGLTVASDFMAGVESATIGVWVAAGARHEPAEVNGIAHLLELIPYKRAPREKIKLPERSDKGTYDDQATLKGRTFVPEKY